MCIYIIYTHIFTHCSFPICLLNIGTSECEDHVLFNIVKSEFRTHWLIYVHGGYTGNVSQMKKFTLNHLAYYFENLMAHNLKISHYCIRIIINIKNKPLKVNFRVTST